MKHLTVFEEFSFEDQLDTDLKSETDFNYGGYYPKNFWSKYKESVTKRLVDEFEKDPRRGDHIWDGATLEFQILNLLCKALYRVVNDGDSPWERGQTGWSEMKLGLELLQQHFNSQELSHMSGKLKGLDELFFLLDYIAKRIKFGSETHSINIQDRLRKYWQKENEDQRDEYYKEFNENVEEKMSYHEAFELFIKGQKALRQVSIPAFGDHTKPHDQRYYGDGIEFENGYAALAYGGGCSGHDCNTYFIVDLKTDRLVACYDSQD